MRTAYGLCGAAFVVNLAWAVDARAACDPGYEQVAVFRDANFQGACSLLDIGRFDGSARMGLSNDSISSLKVGGGVRALLFEHGNFGGRQALYEGGSEYGKLGSVNERTSSVAVLGRASPAAFWYLGNNPSAIQTSWARDVQGIASSEYDAWFVTNQTSIFEYAIERISGAGGARRVIDMPPELARRGCDHFGDPDALSGYLLVPVEGCADGPIVAVFTASDLTLVCYDVLYRQAQAPWLALDPLGNLVSSGNTIGPDSPLVVYNVDWNAVYPDPEPHWFLYDGPQSTLADASGVPLSFGWVQGGDLNEDGSLLYMSNGGPGCKGGDTGLRILETSSYSQIAHSGNGYGPFNYQHSCDSAAGEEAEGLDYRNMNGRGAAFAGALHVLLLDNDAVTSGDDAYLKHYDL